MEEALKIIEIWANSSEKFLSESTPYQQGYADGLRVARKTIIGILRKCEEEKNKNNENGKNRF